jgi:hypothetical protein
MPSVCLCSVPHTQHMRMQCECSTHLQVVSDDARSIAQPVGTVWQVSELCCATQAAEQRAKRQRVMPGVRRLGGDVATMRGLPPALAAARAAERRAADNKWCPGELLASRGAAGQQPGPGFGLPGICWSAPAPRQLCTPPVAVAGGVSARPEAAADGGGWWVLACVSGAARTPLGSWLALWASERVGWTARQGCLAAAGQWWS